jgi:hypothetical protein
MVQGVTLEDISTTDIITGRMPATTTDMSAIEGSAAWCATCSSSRRCGDPS